MKTDWNVWGWAVAAMIAVLGGASAGALTVDSTYENSPRNPDVAVKAYARIYTQLQVEVKEYAGQSGTPTDREHAFPLPFPTGKILTPAAPGSAAVPSASVTPQEDGLLLDLSSFAPGDPAAALRPATASMVLWPEKHSAMTQPEDPNSGPAEAEDWLFTLQYADFPQNTPRSPLIPVPEPATCTLLLLGTGLLVRKRFYA